MNKDFIKLAVIALTAVFSFSGQRVPAKICEAVSNSECPLDCASAEECECENGYYVETKNCEETDREYSSSKADMNRKGAAKKAMEKEQRLYSN